MLAEEPAIARVVTSTTRAPRRKEQDGIDYHFLNALDFQTKIAAGNFYEYARVHGHLYGTMKSAVQDKLRAGVDLLLNIDVQGANTFRQTARTDALLQNRITTVFIMPPDLETLERRLRSRRTDSENEIQRRLNVARQELKHADRYDHVLLTQTREEDFENLRAIYRTEKTDDNLI